MNARTAVTVGAVILCAVIGVAVGRCAQTDPLPEMTVSEPVSGLPKQQSPTVRAQKQGGEEAADQREEYWLREVDGRLGVFLADAEKPEMILDVYLSSLPEADRMALQNGIVADSYRQLLSMIEDYIS
ncbi:MAG: hypothetical protein IKU72_05060 [Oscillospiraceae bacterium]|nr:hypothetical protein [Oscillospiraceae bacterium]